MVLQMACACHSIAEMKGRRFPQIAILLVVAIGAVAWWESSQPTRKLATEVYVWQRADSPELREALDRSHELATRRHFLGVEISRSSNGLQVVRSSMPDDLLRGEGLVLRIGSSLSGESWGGGEAMERVLAEATWLAARPAAELQIDYDCPQSSLDGYRILLEKIKARHPGKRWTITALPSWLEEPAAKRLFQAADGVVMQVHSLQLPQRPGQPVVLCDPATARAAVDKISKMGIPFHVALNTYGCEVFYDADGRVLEVVSEDVQSPPRNAARRAVGLSDAVELAGLVAAWKRNPPPGLQGVVWYRLPLASDRRNWRWITWQRVAAGIPPVSDLQLDARAAGNGAWDLMLSNRGERDERLPEFVSAGCQTLVLEGLNGYVSHAADRLYLETTAWPWLPPGASITIGWLRPAQASVQPTPAVITPP